MNWQGLSTCYNTIICHEAVCLVTPWRHFAAQLHLLSVVGGGVEGGVGWEENSQAAEDWRIFRLGSCLEMEKTVFAFRLKWEQLMVFSSCCRVWELAALPSLSCTLDIWRCSLWPTHPKDQSQPKARDLAKECRSQCLALSRLVSLPSASCITLTLSLPCAGHLGCGGEGDRQDACLHGAQGLVGWFS